MLPDPLLSRIDRRCASALLKAIDAFPQLLAASEPEAAAAIVADLIKAQLARPAEPTDPGAALAEVIRALHRAEDPAPASPNS